MFWMCSGEECHDHWQLDVTVLSIHASAPAVLTTVAYESEVQMLAQWKKWISAVIWK